MTFAIALLIMFTSFRRSRLGVSGPARRVDVRGPARPHLQAGRPAELPRDWLVESEARSAGGTGFAGDFVVAQAHQRRRLDLVVVDVSGKGVEAGARSLFLSGAFNGIVSALPGDQFLPAANDYLIGQDWGEGFATAIHLHLDLQDRRLRAAQGRPPACRLAARRLGPMVGAELRRSGTRADPRRLVRGALAAGCSYGDGLLLFTDGLVETAQRDISLGIDKLAGLGERLLAKGFDGGARC